MFTRKDGRKRIVEELARLLGKNKVYSDEAVVGLYSRESSGLSAREKPIAVVFPESTRDLSRLASYAYRNEVKLFPQGSGTSLSGSSIPLEEGVVVSFERMNRIKEVSIVDSIVVAEPGVRLEEINLELARHGYMFPIDPASISVATVGGAINNGAGGMRGAKYGTMRDWVLGLEIVLPNEKGSVLRVGCRTVKCRQGYDLVRLIVGSEGTLALVSEAVLRIAPLPESVVTVLAFYDDLVDLAETVVDIKASRIQPYIMEFMDSRTVEVAASFSKPPFKASGHMLLVSIDVNREASSRVLEWLVGVVRKHRASRVYTASSLEEAEEKKLFEIRRSLFPAQVYLSREKLGIESPMVLIEDIAVPPSRLVEAVEGLRSLEEKYGFYTLIGGHIGDGNLHPAVGFDPSKPSDASRVEKWALDVMRLAVELGGTVSSEHGIGVLKKAGLELELKALGSLEALEIMRGIKRVFDPKNILNPGKIF